MLVVNSQPLGFDMLLEIDIIKILGGININLSSEVIFNKTDPPVCAAIRIEEVDFFAAFNEQISVNIIIEMVWGSFT